MPLLMDRQQAWDLLCEYTQNENLRRHMLAVEAALRAYAGSLARTRRNGAWSGCCTTSTTSAGRTHPTIRCRARRSWPQRGYPEDVIYAIKSHADYLDDCPRVSLLDKTLYACDELSGFIAACALVRPEGLAGLRPRACGRR